MLNGFHIAHGGIAYSLAYSALAFASNSNGKKSLSIETSISHTISIKDGDELTATTEELSVTDKIGVYLITVTNNKDQEIATYYYVINLNIDNRNYNGSVTIKR